MRARAKANGPRAGRIIDGMFQAIGEQTVTVPGTLTAERIIPPPIARDIKTIKDRRRDLAAQVEKLPEGHPLPTVLTSMPGAGVRTASNIPLGIGGDVAASRARPTWPRTPASPPSPASPAPASKANAPPEEATNDSRTRCGNPRSSPASNTPCPPPATNANANRANTTTPPSSASPDDAATSSTACSKTDPSTKDNVRIIAQIG